LKSFFLLSIYRPNLAGSSLNDTVAAAAALPSTTTTTSRSSM
jgi:hypothetical protein